MHHWVGTGTELDQAQEILSSTTGCSSRTSGRIAVRHRAGDELRLPVNRGADPISERCVLNEDRCSSEIPTYSQRILTSRASRSPDQPSA
jgi:hypothetical protein